MTSMRRFASAAMAAFVVSVAVNPVSAVLFRETFDTASSGEANFEATYPSLNFTTTNAGGSVSTGSGILTLNLNNGTNTVQEAVVIPSGFADTHRISALVSAGNSNGNYNVGIRIGGNNIVFHPNFPGAALRVDGGGGFGNTNVGFTPPNNTLHLLKIDQTPAGLFNIRLVNGANPSNVFTTSFSNPASVDGQVALRRSGPGSAALTQTGLYDALTVTSSNTLFYEGFDLNVANGTQFANANPDFTQSLGAGMNLDVSGGVARLGGSSADSNFVVNGLGNPPAAGWLKIEADIGASNSNGNYNVGLRIGQNNIVFHPGFAPIPGAFRVEGPGGFGNTSMGFVPGNGVLHHFEVLEHLSGLFIIKVTDANNPANVFTASFTNPGSVGGGIGFRREGGPGTEFGLFDNLRVERVMIPEPASMGLMAVAGLAMLRRRRKA